eukprot:GHVP01036982.1.p1 GENE.GHVP01036982.1~~GHVP01036982.1.p1  ORF type:complete len:183 (+),score=44.35 GHVP01036982.1:365-913(+)
MHSGTRALRGVSILEPQQDSKVLTPRTNSTELENDQTPRNKLRKKSESKNSTHKKRLAAQENEKRERKEDFAEEEFNKWFDNGKKKNLKEEAKEKEVNDLTKKNKKQEDDANKILMEYHRKWVNERQSLPNHTKKGVKVVCKDLFWNTPHMITPTNGEIVYLKKDCGGTWTCLLKNEKLDCR